MNNLPTYTFTKRIYYVSSPTDDTVVLAIDPIMDHDTVTWFDTIKERVKPIREILKSEENEFQFLSRRGDEDGDVYTFVPLTVELYEQYVKQHLIDPQPYQNEEHLFSLILATRETAW